MIRIASAAVLCVSLAACGGGGSGTGASLPTTVQTPAQGHANATFVVTIPVKAAAASANKAAKYITANVKGIDFTVTQTGSTLSSYVFYALTAQSSYCSSTSAGLTCTVQVVAPPGNDTFTVRLFDAAEIYTGYVLATGTITQAINAQAANTVNITTYGVATFASVGTSNPYPSVGVAATIPLDVNITDPDGAYIVGAFDAPVTLSDSDTSGATTLSKTSLAQSSDETGLTLAYSGNGNAVATIGVTGTSPQLAFQGVAPLLGKITVSPGVMGPAASPGALYFAHASSAAQPVAIKASFNPVTLTAGSCGSAVSISGTSPNFTVTPVASSFSATLPAYTTGGACTITATDSATHSTNISVLIGL